MAGSYQTISALVTEAGTTYPGGGAGVSSWSAILQFALDNIATLAPSETALTFASSLAWALDTNPIATVTLTGNVTITASAGQNGHIYRLAVKQDATGGRAVTLAGVTLLGAAVWNTAANATNLLTIDVSAGTRYAGVM